MNVWVEFVRARLDDDEQVALAASEGGGPDWPTGSNDRVTPSLAHARRHDPARVLREVDTARELLADLLAEPHFTCDDPFYSCYATLEPGDLGDIEVGVCNCGRDARVLSRVKIMARPYAGHEDYPAE